MLKQAIQISLASAALFIAGSSQAALYWDVDTFTTSQGHVVAGGPGLSETFNITGPGLGRGYILPANGGTETVTSVLFAFSLLDDKDGIDEVQSESWQFDLGTDTGVASGSSNGWFGTVVFGLGSADVMMDIQEDGQIGYVISANSGDFFVLNASIAVTTESRSQTTNRVPDGGLTLVLLGAGVFAITALRRRI